MRFLIAPDSFKGSLSSLDAARAIAEGLHRAGHADMKLIPIADGGEGTVEALCVATQGKMHSAIVRGPLGGDVEAHWGMLGDGRTAVVELAAASGLTLIRENERDILRASTYGTGELMRIALAHGCKRLILAIGGSATNDGGAGIAQALGIGLLDQAGVPIGPGGEALLSLERIDLSTAAPMLKGVEIIVACDVTNPLCGPDGAAAVYGPQKGGTPEQLRRLDDALRHFAKIVRRDVGRDILDLPGSGAAGGAGGGMLGLLGAWLEPGFPLIARETMLEGHIAQAECVITGEGRTDAQTCFGKVPMGIAQIARPLGVPVLCVSGGLGQNWQALYEHGVTACFSIADGPMPLEDAMRRAGRLLSDAAESLGRTISAFTIR